MRRLGGILVLLILSGCGTSAEVAVPVASRTDSGQGCATPGVAPIKVLFLAKEAVPNELDGVRYFVQDWGRHKACFDGQVVTTARPGDMAHVAVVVVDVSHDEQLSADDVQALQGFIAGGKRVAVFGWPMRLSGLSVIPSPLSGLETSLGGVRFSIARGCGDWKYAQAPSTPFNLGDSYRYENFGGAVFTVSAGVPQRHWADNLFCPHFPGATMIEVPAGAVAGFSFGYSVSLADNNIRATGMKRLVVDTIHALASPATLS